MFHYDLTYYHKGSILGYSNLWKAPDHPNSLQPQCRWRQRILPQRRCRCRCRGPAVESDIPDMKRIFSTAPDITMVPNMWCLILLNPVEFHSYI